MSRCTLGLTNLDPFFDGWIYPRRSCAEQTASELFLHAADTMTTADAGCALVEESLSGIQAL
jgi:beta-phosphoglucomutase-like phosphatase (HAD superfamily)